MAVHVPRTVTTASASHSHLGSAGPSSPVRTSVATKGGNSDNTNHTHAGNTTPQRPRLSSRDIPRSYAGLYGQGGPGSDDLLPFELARSEHTDWLENGGLLLWGIYLGGIVIFEVVVLAILDSYQSSLSSSFSSTLSTSSTSSSSFPLYWSWTITNAVHCLLTTIYLHWLKGSLFDEQGEMAGMTLWEQLEGRSHTSSLKRLLTAVPTLLCYAACHFSEYATAICVCNIILWAIQVAGKLPFMNGVRILGINRTTGMEYSAPEIHGPPLQHQPPSRRRLRSYDSGAGKHD